MALEMSFVRAFISALFNFFTIISGKELATVARSLYRFGPEGVERIRKIVLAMTALVAAIITLWAIFSE